MAISFNEMPGNSRVPGIYIEVDNSRAISGLAQLNTCILVIAQRLNTGTLLPGVPTLVTSKAQAINYGGRGSMLAAMFNTLFDNNVYTEKWVVALDDNPAGVAATGSIAVSGTATASGTINLYIASQRIQIAVATSDSANTIAAAIHSAINTNVDLPVTATVSTNTVTITARHKGSVGNTIDMRLNYRGVLSGEKTPAGIALTLTPLSGGTGDPDIAVAISALPEDIFDFWLLPYTDANNLDKLATELNSRWSPLRMLEGHAFVAELGTISALGTLGNSRNDQHVTLFDAAYNSPSPAYLWAAALCGQVAFAATNDPARPFNTLPLIGILPPPPEDRRTFTERNTLLYDGVATHKVTKAGQVQIERVTTTYQLNSGGTPDASYLDANTLFTLSYLRQTMRARITQKFPRHKLADDGTKVGAGQAIATPSLVKSELIALAGQWQEDKGLVEDLEQFKKELVVERNATDRNRLDIMLPPNLVNQLQIIAAQISFIL